jgi:hypothetical protein
MTKGVLLRLVILVFAASLPAPATGEFYQSEVVEDNLEVPSPNASEKVTIGEVEDVMLEPWAITLPARVDTGATLSSLDARDLRVRDNIADFVLGKRYGSVRLRLPVVDWIYVRNSAGVEKRPVAKIHICLGPKKIRALATLRDRSQMTYPFLVGRNVLNGSFMVDTSRSRAVRPKCRLDSTSTSLK